MIHWCTIARLFVAAIALAGVTASPSQAQRAGASQTLPRRAILGVAPQDVPQPIAARIGPAVGTLAAVVTPDLTAHRMGVRAGDVILDLNGQPIRSPEDLVAGAGRLAAGDQVRMLVWRDGKRLQLTGKAQQRPLESYQRARTRYGVVPFGGGLLRDIMVTPDKPAAGAPVVYLIQGVTCASIDYPDPRTAHRMLIQMLADRGIATYRVEKPGVGDSRSPRPCPTLDFDEELAAFDAAYTHLQKTYSIGADRIFMLGHSLGGLQAPLLAAKRPPRGVAVYGTVLRNWHDYHFDVARFQSTLNGTADPVESAQQAERARKLIDRFFFDRASLEALAKERPENDGLMRETLGWQGGNSLFGRHESYFHDLAALDLVNAWRDTRSRVLALYGESDTTALYDEDHKLIAIIANYYRPGTGRFVEVAGADHGMNQIGDREALRKAMRATGQPPQGAFEPRIATTLADWVLASMAEPPVRTLQFGTPQRQQ